MHYFYYFADKEPPRIFNTISNVYGFIESNETQTIVNWIDPIVSDNSGFVTLTQDHYPGDVFNLGETIVTYKAIDSSYNVAIHTFIVHIEGT